VAMVERKSQQSGVGRHMDGVGNCNCIGEEQERGYNMLAIAWTKEKGQ